jgi:hypothetical protein
MSDFLNFKDVLIVATHNVLWLSLALVRRRRGMALLQAGVRAEQFAAASVRLGSGRWST